MTYAEIKNITIDLRKNPTESESILWKELRNRKVKGIKFLRQHPIIYEINKNDLFFYIADFYCAEYKIAIELDGKIHEYRKSKDYNRDMILRKNGIRTIRIKNEEIKNIEVVKNKITSFITHP
jgi:very-short-patch-repair endonuclease